jgi:hypothetical protein
MNAKVVDALKMIAAGFTLLAEAVDPNLEVAGTAESAGNRGRRKPEKETPPPAEEPEVTTTEEPDDPFPSADGEAEAPTLKDIQVAAKELIANGKRSQLQAALAKHKAGSLSDVAEADYVKFLAELKK